MRVRKYTFGPLRSAVDLKRRDLWTTYPIPYLWHISIRFKILDAVLSGIGVGRSMLCSHDRLLLHSRRCKNPFPTPASLACDCSSACTGRTAIQTVPTQVRRRDAFSFLALRSALFWDVRQLSRRRFGTTVGAVFLDFFVTTVLLNNRTGMCLRNVGHYRLTPRRKPETTHIYRTFCVLLYNLDGGMQDITACRLRMGFINSVFGCLQWII
jgi:hypothetical protein